MAKTKVASIRNDSDSKIVFEVRESSGGNTDVPPGDTRNPNEDIPWVSNENDFDEKAIVIRDIDAKKNLCFIWQRKVGSDDRVRISTNGWQDPGEYISGNSGVGGSRQLIIDSNKEVKLE